MEAQTSEPTRMLVQVSFRKPRWWRRGAGPALTTAGRVCKFWLICRPDRSLPSGFRSVDIKVLLNNAYERTFNDFDITSPVNADHGAVRWEVTYAVTTFSLDSAYANQGRKADQDC